LRRLVFDVFDDDGDDVHVGLVAFRLLFLIISLLNFGPVLIEVAFQESSVLDTFMFLPISAQDSA